MTDRRDRKTPDGEGKGRSTSDRPVAVALRYDLDPNSVPRIVATARGELAGNILAAARAAGVEIREDADLAELLGALDIGDDIPAEAFVAVAEVLRYVFEANGKMRELEQREESKE